MTNRIDLPTGEELSPTVVRPAPAGTNGAHAELTPRFTTSAAGPDPLEHARLLASAEGNNLHNAEAYARDYTRGQQRGEREAIVAAQADLAAEKKQHQADEESARARVRRTAETIREKNGGRPLRFVGGLILAVMILGLLGALVVEQFGAAHALQETGAFNITSIGEGVMMTMTAVAVGFALKLAYHALAPRIRRWSLAFACVALIGLFGTWAWNFAREAGRAADEHAATQTLSAGENVGDSAGGGGTQTPELAQGPEASSAAWLMFFALASLMVMTTFVGSIGVSCFLDSYDTWVPNPEHSRALDELNFHTGEIRSLAARQGRLNQQLAQLLDSENSSAALARAAYLTQRTQGNAPEYATGGTSAGIAKAVSLILMVAFGVTMTGCGEKGGKAEYSGLEPAKSVIRETRVLAISPRLPAEARKTAAAQLDLEIAWLARDAAPGSAVLVFDAYENRPVATLRAVRGVQRVRQKALLRPLAAVRGFLQQAHPGAESDGLIRLPQLAQSLAQSRLPAGTHVTVFGNPLFIGEASDEVFSMKDGRVPMDGFLFLEPRLSVYSTAGREAALSGQFWHMGYPSGAVWIDDSHKQGVTRFWSVYLRSMGATLVTLQPSLAAAAQAGREGQSGSLLADQADPKAEAKMLRIVKVVRNQTTVNGTEVQREQHADGSATAAAPGGETVRLDKFSNPVGSQHDLVPDGALRGQRALVITFDHDEDLENSPLPAALRAKGCEVERIRYPLPQLAAWKSALASANQVWVLSSRERDHFPRSHQDALVERWKNGQLALYLAGDDEPYVQEANVLLRKIAPGVELRGNYRGGKNLTGMTGLNGAGFDAASPLFHGVNAFHEGDTVSELRGNGFTSVCRNSRGAVLLAVIESPGRGRVVVDGGFTRWFPRHWESAGAPRLAANIASWLAGAEKGKASALVAK